jgi:hypothetical protein
MNIRYCRFPGTIREITIDPDQPLIRVCEAVSCPGTVASAVCLRLCPPQGATASPKPLDVWQTPRDQGISEGATIIAAVSIAGGAGTLPLNALSRDFDRLRRLLREEHAGLQAAFLYTPADAPLSEFMQSFIPREMPELSGDIVVYAPIDDLFKQNNSEFLAWWRTEYQGLGFAKALQRAQPLFCTSTKAVYDVLRALKLPEDALPCILFFENRTGEHTVLRLTQTDSPVLLVHTLRQVFREASEVNKLPGPGRIKVLTKRLNSFLKETKARKIELPITLLKLEFNGVSLKALPQTLIGALFTRE